MSKKKSLLSIFLTLCVSASAQLHKDDAVVLTIDGEPFYKSEFEYIYNKNNTSAAEKKTVDEYVDLFVNYKLKVIDAKEHKYDKRVAYVEEYQRYREQLAIPYIIDNGEKERLIQEAYERSKVSLAASHILIKTNRKDSIPALARISKIYDELVAGASFAELAKKYSDCPSGKQGGYLGYFSAFEMVYPFENAAYNTPVGKFSKPFATEFGYHIVKISDSKPNFTKVKVSEIHLPLSTSDEKLDSLYKVVKKKSKKFDKFALQYNTDGIAGGKSGKMSWIEKGSGVLPPNVEKEFFDFSKKGEIKAFSAFPIANMIVRLDSSNVDLPLSDSYDKLAEKVMQSDRASNISERFLDNLSTKLSYAILDSTALYEFLDIVNDSVTERGNYLSKYNKPLFTVIDITYPQSTIFSVIENNIIKYRGYKNGNSNREDRQKFAEVHNDSSLIRVIYDDYISNLLKVIAYDQLENSNIEFHNILREYSDGLLLFSYSNERVWNKSLNDSNGLRAYFNNNKKNYKWDKEHFVGRVVYCKNAKIKNKVDKLFDSFGGTVPENVDSILKKQFVVYEFVNQKVENCDIIIKKGAFLPGANGAVDTYVFKTVDKYEVEKPAMPEVSVYGVVTTEPDDMKEIKGLVIADYQNYLESKWVNELREKHDIIINKEVLKTINAK